jgi:phosphoribosylformimino-5-aminoimidazole carboxamide ribotide isomerase
MKVIFMFIMPAWTLKMVNAFSLFRENWNRTVVLENPAEVAKGWEDRVPVCCMLLTLVGPRRGGNIPV